MTRLRFLQQGTIAICLLAVLLAFNSCRKHSDVTVEDITPKQKAELMSEGFRYVMTEYIKNQNHPFIKQLRTAPLWDKAVMDAKGNIRIPLITIEKTSSKFEYYLQRTQNGFKGKILQFIPFGDSNRKYRRITYDMSGKQIGRIAFKSKYSLLNRSSGNAKGKVMSGPMSYDEQDVIDKFTTLVGEPPLNIFLMSCAEGTYFNEPTCNCQSKSLVGEGSPFYFMGTFAAHEPAYISAYGIIDLPPEDPNDPGNPVGGGGGTPGGGGGSGGSGGSGGTPAEVTISAPELATNYGWLCGYYYSTPVGDSWTGGIRNLGFEVTGPDGFDGRATQLVLFSTGCWEVPSYFWDSTQASSIVKVAWNLGLTMMIAALQTRLLSVNAGLPAYFKGVFILNLNAAAPGSSFSSGPCSNVMVYSMAEYCPTPN